ncbi:hypothetical protein M8Z33_13280 [Streptomyces sp. ZAF1911]|uniref:hypothetical protein n=1 Tax=unclassified Streptomyces TaxID=2593676 RepID=UPI00237AD5EF|nr:hypothetical protein [Streptomyces sp. ZAF1911]MDD9377613.1 hypothetical protein [Streptomyces sp. ZAF1911]
MHHRARTLARLLTGAATTLAVGALAVSPASAAGASSSCETVGAYGSADWTWLNGSTLLQVRLTSVDTSDDARVAGIRLYTLDHHGGSHDWPWRLNKRGAGKSQTWETTLQDKRGIDRVGVEAAAFNDAGYRRLCGSASVKNPTF